MDNVFIEDKNLLKVNHKNKIKKFLIVIGIVVLVLLVMVVVLWKTGIIDKIFTPKPGSCLVFQQKYCDKGKLVYNNGNLAGVIFSVKAGTKLMAPVGADVLTSTIDNTSEKMVIIGSNSFSEGKVNLDYRVNFFGDVNSQIEKINKGDVFGEVTKDNKGSSWIFLTIENVSWNSDGLERVVNEEKVRKLISN